MQCTYQVNRDFHSYDKLCRLRFSIFFYKIDLGPTVYTLGDKLHGLSCVNQEDATITFEVL